MINPTYFESQIQTPKDPGVVGFPSIQLRPPYYSAACKVFTRSMTSSDVVSPCVIHARMISRPSKVAAATQARPDVRIRPTINPTSPGPPGGVMHNPARGESLAISHPRAPSFLLRNALRPL